MGLRFFAVPVSTPGSVRAGPEWLSGKSQGLVNRAKADRRRSETLIEFHKRCREFAANDLGLEFKPSGVFLSGDFVSDALASGRWWQWLALTLDRFQPFIDDPAQMRVHLRFVVSVATRPNDPRTLANETLILIRPFHYLDVPGTVVHDRDSSMAFLTSRS